MTDIALLTICAALGGFGAALALMVWTAAALALVLLGLVLGALDALTHRLAARRMRGTR